MKKKERARESESESESEREQMSVGSLGRGWEMKDIYGNGTMAGSGLMHFSCSPCEHALLG